MIKVGDKALITTQQWFLAPDGLEYKAVFGTVKGIYTDSETLGIKTNARSTNWYAEIGNITIAGCQIFYAIKTDSANLKKVKSWSNSSGSYTEFTRPTEIYNADEGL